MGHMSEGLEVKRKKKKDKKQTGKLRNKLCASRTESSDEDSIPDDASVGTGCSSSTINDIPEEGTESFTTAEEVDSFEDKLCGAIEGMTEKSLKTRVSSIEIVSNALSKQIFSDFVMSRRETISDAVERSLKKGRGSEQVAAARLASLLAIQLRFSDAGDETSQNLIPTLLSVVDNPEMPSLARAKCCWSASLLTFVSNYGDVASLMASLRDVFLVYMKNELSSVLTADDESLYVAAISSWGLLITVSTSADLILYLSEMTNLLDSTSNEIRIQAGETIALIVELLREFEDVEDWNPNEELLMKLKNLATDSCRYHAKKDRKIQKSAFRNIIRYIEEEEFSEINVCYDVINGTKCFVSLDTWCRKKRYDAFVQALGSGLIFHLRRNELVRDVFQLGNYPVIDSDDTPSKLDKCLCNAASNKARNIYRAKKRDKKLVMY